MKRTKHIYKRFISLFIGQSFFIGRRKLAVKAGFATYQEHASEAKTTEQWGKQTPKKTIAPWRKVRTLTPVKTLRPPSGILRNTQQEIAEGKYFPRAKDCLRPDGRTHFVGDDCPGGHQGFPMTGCSSGPNRVQQLSAIDSIYEKIGAEAEAKFPPVTLRDPMVQDHTPSPQPEHERTL